MTNNRDPFNYTANLILRAKPDFEYAREPHLRRMPNGDLVCVCLSGGKTEPANQNLVIISRSKDDGCTWSAPEIIFQHSERAVWATELFCHDNTVCLFLMTYYAPSRYRELILYRSVSIDNGETWSEPQSLPNGIISGSVSILADGFNNLSDMASSLITMIGMKLANRPADKEHPFGHGRIEYLSALVVAFMVMLVGVQFIKTSFERIIHPVAVVFEILPFIFSLLIKFWLSRFNKFVGEKINSSALKAASVDALGDVFTSTCVIISFLAAKFTTFPIDGYMGVIVSLFILYAGFSLVKDTISPLLGESPDEELVKSIKQGVLSYENKTTTKRLGKILNDYDINLDVVLRCPTTEQRINAAKRGIGIAYVMKEAAKSNLKNKKVYEVKLPIELPENSIKLIYLKDRLTKVDKKFIKDYLK